MACPFPSGSFRHRLAPWGCALIFGAGLCAQTPAPPPPIAEPGPPAATVTLEAFEVTGSHLKRVDLESPSPVTVYSAAAIEDKAYGTVGEFMQSLPFNTGLANSEFTLASFITGAATINPRGLGSNRVLTLINGRRGVPYALTNSASGTPQTVFNYNSIPSAAIERIEFLKDGASAIYGSDAITGVSNLILKRKFTGSSVDVFVSNTLGHDSLLRRVNVFTGLAKNGWEITAGVNFQSRHANYLSDFGLTTTDFRYLGPKGQNLNSTIFHPSYLILTAAQALATGMGPGAGVYIIPGGAPGTANPTRTSFSYIGSSTLLLPDANRYDFARVQQVYPASEHYGGFANLSRRFSEKLSVFSQVLFSRSDTHAVLVPYGFSTTLAGLTLPAANPYNPTGLPLTVTANSAPFSFRSAPPRREVTATMASALAGVKGAFLEHWSWESAVSFGTSQATRETDLVRDSDLQAALSGTTRETAYNPFGPSDNPRLVPGLFTRSKGNDGRLTALGGDASVSGSFRPLPFTGAGRIGLAAGYEYRRETLRSDPETSNFLGYTASALPFRGHRHTSSFYLELSLPLQKWLEVQLAGRHEAYSDFGRTTKPKVSTLLRLPASRVLNVLVRGSYSESFKAPDLGQLHQGQSRASTLVFDPLRPQDGVASRVVISGGNPNLRPEAGRVQFLGFVLESPALKGLSVTADYLDVRIDHVINTLSIAYLLSPAGLRQFPNAITRDNSRETPGPITSFLGIADNLGFQLYRGWDFGLRYEQRSARFGSFRFSAELTHIVKRGTDSGQGGGFTDETGRYFAPAWRNSLALGWTRKALGAAITADIIGPYFNNGFTAAGWGENVYPILTPSFTYRGLKRTTLTVGSNNVLDHRPPPNGHVLVGFDDRVYGAGALGRTVFVRLRREF